MAGVIRNSQGTVRSGWKIFLLYVILIFTSLFFGFGVELVGAFSHFKIIDDLLELVQELCEIGSVIIMVY